VKEGRKTFFVMGMSRDYTKGSGTFKVESCGAEIERCVEQSCHQESGGV
jgi:hypothetical protein